MRRPSAASTASSYTAAVMSILTIVVVSPSSASGTVTLTTAPVSRATGCSTLCARWVRRPYPRKHRLVRLHVDQPPRARQGRMARRRIGQLQVQKLPDTQRVNAPRDRPLRIQAFKVAEQQQPETPTERQTRPTDPGGIERRAQPLNEGVKARVAEQTNQPLVERVAGAAPWIPLATHILFCNARRRRWPMATRASVVRGIHRADPEPGLSPRAVRRQCPYLRLTDLRKREEYDPSD